MSIEIIGYSNEHAGLWDSWCIEANNATFLHTRQFLNYHKTRFEDCSVLIYKSGDLVGVLPAARDTNDPALVVSHLGATYGGIVHKNQLSGERLIEAFELIKIFYREQGYREFLYKPLPYSYARIPSQDDLYALFRLGAQRARCDLSCSIDLHARRVPSERRKRSYKKALKLGTQVGGADLLEDFWNVLEENLSRKHDAKPVHSLDEFRELMEKFPDNILLRCAMIDGQVEAGVVLFKSHHLWHAQYIASSTIGYTASALDVVFESAIVEAMNAGARYFDFGTSNEDNGLVLNDDLYRFKLEFGGGGIVHEYYKLKLQ